MKRRVVLLGPPGSGKGTLAKMLEAKHGLKHISSGAWFRHEIESGTPFGMMVKEHIDKGELVPDGEVVGLIHNWLGNGVIEQGFLLDGFPRTLNQADELEKYCQRFGFKIEAVLFCDCPDEVLIDRATGRRVCSTCGAGYHVRNWPPSVPGKCDKCGGVLVKREDDREEVVISRLEIYSRLTAPLVQYYQDAGLLKRLDASRPLKDLLEPAEKALGI